VVVTRRVVQLAVLAWLGAVFLAAVACGSTKASTRESQTVTFLTGPSGGAYNPLGRSLADIYNAKIPSARVVVRASDGPEGASANAQAVDAGSADLAFSRSDLAYMVYEAGTPLDQPSRSHLRSVAVVYTNALHIVVRRASGIRSGHDFAGHRVQVGDAATADSMVRMILDAYGVADRTTQVRSNSRGALERLRAGDFDVRIFASAYPLASIDDVSDQSDIRLLSIEPDVRDRLRSRFPFFKPAVIPRHTYRGQDEDIQTVGIDGLLLCRDALPESLVYEMTKTLFDALPDLSRSDQAARLINVGRAPSTPVPLHPGAARYYRERDLFR
jgi:TRAP transporter TAXI family solute receptor